ncbi:MAG: ThuA domain-containing protein [Verrucomicrobia bacterium]|nr:ThuA domain-containing protein [Verrucomicrobiota bacterium]
MKRSTFFRLLAALVALPFLTSCSNAADSAAKIPVLIVDGQNNHDWKTTTPVLKQILEQSGRFTVEVATTPPAKSDMTPFKPKFSDYKAVILNYNGDPWSPETMDAFVAYVKGGGGFVSYHAADNSFPAWKEYNEMIGIGGWNKRSEKDGPYIRYWEGKIIRDESPGPGGHHGAQHPFAIDVREPSHPIMAGLPPKMMHGQDELYDLLRGPAENLTVLATAYADPAAHGSGMHEPMLMTIAYGKGRVFHTTLGHALPAMKCATFAITTQRGVEWAATGKVTIPAPKDLSADSVVVPEYLK